MLKANLGVEIEVRAADWSDYMAGLERREYQAFVLSWRADWPDASAFMEALFRSAGPQNSFAYSDAAVDADLDRAALELDPLRRAALYTQAEQHIIRSAVLVPLFHPVSYTLVRPTVRQLTLTPLGILNLRETYVDGRR